MSSPIISQLSPSRLEVMQHIEPYVKRMLGKFLKPIDKNWQPADLLPNAAHDDFFDKVKELQSQAKELSYDFWVVLIGDMITEEALPTYESWLLAMNGVDRGNKDCAWTQWVRGWTAEENRHGDLLNKYLYLSGRVDMQKVEISTQYLIKDGFDIGTGADPYRNFVYTSFQELATYISHKRVAEIAKKHDNHELATMCKTIAIDEYRHGSAYMTFIEKIIEVDPNEAMLAFADMMRKKIVMPAHYLCELGVQIGETFKHFSDSAQRIGVYTAEDYIDILNILIKKWDIEHIKELNDAGEKARDYVMALPDRLARVAKRIKVSESEYEFSWIYKRKTPTMVNGI
ncbi:MAG: acyl-ACP desaturase [Bernardetiaceae bacterium]|nr:acyl-ACP desaturase [Bernardetiaceae bacterium]